MFPSSDYQPPMVVHTTEKTSFLQKETPRAPKKGEGGRNGDVIIREDVVGGKRKNGGNSFPEWNDNPFSKKGERFFLLSLILQNVT